MGTSPALQAGKSPAVQALTRSLSAACDTTYYFAANATTDKEKTCELPHRNIIIIMLDVLGEQA